MPLTVAPPPRRQCARRCPAHAARWALTAVCALLWLAAALLPATSSAYFADSFEQRYFFEEDGLITDHSLIWVPGDSYHLFYAVGYAGEGWWAPDNMVDFGHATSPDLINWTVQPRVLSIQAGTWKDRNLFAPQVMENPPHGWMMYYTGLDSIIVAPDSVHIMQAIGVASSTNLYDWVDLSIDEPAYQPDTTWAAWSPELPWSHCRDPFAWRVDGGVLLITTALAKAAYTGTDNKGALSIAESTGGVQFDDLGAPLFLNDTYRVFESASIYRRPDRYFLFYHEFDVVGIHYMTSTNLITGWDKSNAQTLEPDTGFGPGEVVYANGATLFSRVIDVDFNGVVHYGAKIDTLNWTRESTQYVSTNTLWDGWSIVDGHAFDHQPAFGDRPVVRGGPRSRFEGSFWLNSAETYDGPLDIRDPDAPPVYEATGILRSHSFQITGGHISLRVGGGNDLDSLYVALVDASTDTILARATGTGVDPNLPDSNVLYLRHWNLEGMQGMEVYIEIVDLRQDAPHGYIAVDAIEEEQGAGTGVEDAGSPSLTGLRLGAPYPNPVWRGATLPLALDRPGRVRLALYDVQGRMRRLIRDADLPAGFHQLTWDGLDADGRSPAAGIYFVRLDAGGQGVSQKIVIDR